MNLNFSELYIPWPSNTQQSEKKIIGNGSRSSENETYVLVPRTIPFKNKTV